MENSWWKFKNKNASIEAGLIEHPKTGEKIWGLKILLAQQTYFFFGLFIVNASLKILITEVMLNCDSGSDWDSIQLGKFGCFKQGIEA